MSDDPEDQQSIVEPLDPRSVAERLISTRTASSADEFLDWLEPRGDVFRRSNATEWLFRGLGSRLYELTPTALRSENRDRVLRSRYANLKEYPDIAVTQILAEMNLVAEFTDMADEIGLHLPQLDAKEIEKLARFRVSIRQFLERTKGKSAGEYGASVFELMNQLTDAAWPSYGFLSVLALGRHVGLATRLLDWTFDPEVAAYFACADALPKMSADSSKGVAEGEISIWSIHRSLLSSYNSKAYNIRPHEVSLIPVPYAPNRNMHAQLGALTVVPVTVSEMHDPVDRRPIDKIIVDRLCSFYTREQVAAASAHLESGPLIYHFTLSWRFVPRLMALLYRARKGAHRAFPSFEGVVKGMDEWDMLRQLLSSSADDPTE